ncbi:MAG: cell division protein ZapA [Saprospiraceae bacterium]|nr:cell division protein ZapA [Saprospiraceae bacterium]
MLENDLKSITVTIAGRKFPLKVALNEEALVLEMEQELNDKVSEYQQTYSSRDKLDAVIMTLITYTFDQKKPSDNISLDAALDKIQSIKNMLHEIIND